KILLSDRIGNQRSYEYSIEKSDTRVPDIKLSGVENFKTYSEPVKAEIEISDEDSGIKKAFINVTKRDQNGNEISNRLYNNSSITFNEDGNYIIEIGAEDKEGNVRRVKRMFTVDLSAPEIEPLDSFNKKVLSSFAIEGNIKKLINDYSYVNVDMLLNGSDYDGSEVSTPGKYVLKLTATDEAGRSSSRKAEFIISGNEVGKTEDMNLVPDGIIKKQEDLKQKQIIKKSGTGETIVPKNIVKSVKMNEPSGESGTMTVSQKDISTKTISKNGPGNKDDGEKKSFDLLDEIFGFFDSFLF
ncbi:MAG: Ig-like domain repeat protein, partial [Lachnospiraceae bacterium]|nr:Ig-like domain repeat protein [Lachnospiraceae bacterium]